MSVNYKNKVSVIVPIYNVDKYLNKCIDSIVNQSYINLEIILINDGSNDNSLTICKKWQSIDSRIIIIDKENGGLSDVRKIGISVATGDYILFVDGDDWIESSTICECLDNALMYSSDCVLFGYIREYNNKSINNPLYSTDFILNNSFLINEFHRRLIGFDSDNLNSPQCIDNFSTVCMKFYKTNIARKGKIVSERIVGTSEDTIFNIYALENCKVITYLNKCLYHYRKTNELSITSKYKKNLPDKWDVLYEHFNEYLISNNKPNSYFIAFYNRVVCGIIGLGLNEISSNNSFLSKVRNIKKILNKPLYKKSLKIFKLKSCKLIWKVFFLFCKMHLNFFVTVMLLIMNKLRSKY